MTRPDWDTYFMNFARLAEQRSTCLRRRVGAVIVKERMVLATGYNGAPKGLAHCSAVGCLREQRNIPSGERAELCRGLHAEQNAIIQASYHGVAIRDAAMYCTISPCVICVKMIINAGIKRVFFCGLYDDRLAQEMAAEAGLELIRLEVPSEPSGR